MAAAVQLLHPPQDVAQDPALERRVDALLQGAEARLDRPVGVAGPGSLDLMCALWRRGFQRVEAARGCTSGCADEMCDLLVVTGADAAAILATVEATGSLLRVGGRLAVFTHALKGPWERQRLCSLLTLRGYRCRAEGMHGPVVVAAKPESH